MPPRSARSRWYMVACLPLLVPGVVVAAETTADERMILAHPAYVLTYDADTIRIEGTTRFARMHLYLAKPDKTGFVSFESLDEIDCLHGQYRYTAAFGHRADGTAEPQLRDHPGLGPVGRETPIGVLRDHLCAIHDLRRGRYGVYLQVPGIEAARAVFALLELGLDAKQAAALSSQRYGDWEALRYSLDRHKIGALRRPAVIAALGLLVAEGAKPPPPIVPLAAAVRSGRAGEYVLGRMELVAGIWLKLDGTFQYGLTVGSLDEVAQGTWTADGNRIRLLADAATAHLSNVNFEGWPVMSDGQTLTILRDGDTMVFHRRR